MSAGHGAAEGRPTRNPLAWLLVLVVRAYQTIVSPWLPPTCRYYPSCSTYAVRSLRRHGFIKGTALAAWRLLRCNPWSRGGVDHVPPRGRWSTGWQEDGDGDDGLTVQAGSGHTERARTLEVDTRGARGRAPQDS
ncbi:membrane protein insertion efficiency factor YidD [Georgenia alba]|uniref:Putative membrane protein insertion efficiency factor n=1 Tax=Georgenia alba TaxID=2233858 RepID=A0ABW2Q348_9MICO